MTFAEKIEDTAQESIVACVIGGMGWSDNYMSEHVPTFSDQEEVRNKVISWETARPLLNYEAHQGFGAPECNAIYAWTENWIIFVSQYDGSTSIEKIPRNPRDCKPEMPGG